jgi:hypothetical protein
MFSACYALMPFRLTLHSIKKVSLLATSIGEFFSDLQGCETIL